VYTLYTSSVEHYFNGSEHPYHTPIHIQSIRKLFEQHICMSMCTNNGKKWLSAAQVTPTPRHASATSVKIMRCLQRPPSTPMNPGPSESSRSINGYSAKNHLLGQRTPVEVGKWVSALQAHDGRAQRWVLWQCAARAVGVWDAGWSMGVVTALLGTQEWVWDGKRES
jgi:hypothetical protein